MEILEETVVTELKTDRIVLRWEFKDYKLVRQYNTSRAKQLTSRVYSQSGCKWQMELIITAVKSEGKLIDRLKGSIYLLDCTAKPSSVVVRGIIGIRPKDSPWYEKTHIFGVMMVGDRKSCKSCDVTDPATHLEVVAELDIFLGEPTCKWEKQAQPVIPREENLPEQLRCLQDALATLVNDEKTKDVTVFVKGKEFFAHKAILAMRSSVFRKMFEETTRSRKNSEIVIENTTADAWTYFAQFLYTGRMSLNEEDLPAVATDLLHLATEYEVESLTNHLVSMLKASLHKDNVLIILDLSNQHGLEELQSEAMEVFRRCLDYYKGEKRSDFVSALQKNRSLAELLLNKFLLI